MRVECSAAGELRGKQRELARKSDVSTSMISRIFAGDVVPGALHLVRLAAALHVTVDRIIRMPAVWRKIHDQQ